MLSAAPLLVASPARYSQRKYSHSTPVAGCRRFPRCFRTAQWTPVSSNVSRTVVVSALPPGLSASAWPSNFLFQPGEPPEMGLTELALGVVPSAEDCGERSVDLLHCPVVNSGAWPYCGVRYGGSTRTCPPRSAIHASSSVPASSRDDSPLKTVTGPNTVPVKPRITVELSALISKMFSSRTASVRSAPSCRCRSATHRGTSLCGSSLPTHRYRTAKPRPCPSR